MTHKSALFLCLVLLNCVFHSTKGKFDCHCWEGCRDILTPCQTGCQSGWEGPFCQKQNLAYHKTATQSGVFVDTSDCDPENTVLRPYCGPRLARYAVDGNDDTDYFQGSCAVTNTDRPSAWWNVDLGDMYDIKNIVIYQRQKEIPLLQPSLITVLIDAVPCYNITASQIKHDVINVALNQPINGSMVTLVTTASSNVSIASLTLCEVKIFECSNFWFGDQCQYRCHCLDSKEVCDKSTGTCATGCSPGWHGNNCQLYNVALHKPAYQVGTWGVGGNCTGNVTSCKPRPASLAVDGNRNSDVEEGSCSQTAPGRTITSWSVNLMKLYPISRMRLFFPHNDTFDTQGLEITANGRPCYRSPSQLPLVADITCGQTISGILVSISLPLLNISGAVRERELTLCEVEIYECADYWYGPNCSSLCRCTNTSEVCDKTTGQCPLSRCASGWTGLDCHTACHPGYYGYNCSSTCGHCAENVTCDHVTGQCPGLCRSGFIGSSCQDCIPGLYGVNCDRMCPSECAQNDTCERYNGTCSSACQPHYTGADCNACHNGWYGSDCEYQCGECLNDHQCDKTSGQCPNGCDAGWQGILCKQECPVGTYGPQCNGTCGHCLSSEQCDRMAGVCIGECQEGWTGDKCNKCIDGLYTSNCNKSCGHCLDSDTCDHMTGKCPSGCYAGWKGDNCDQVISETTAKVVSNTPTEVFTTVTSTLTRKQSTTNRTSAQTSKVHKNLSTSTPSSLHTNNQQGLSQGVLAAIVISSVLVFCVTLHSLIFIRYSRRFRRLTRRKTFGGDKVESPDDHCTELPNGNEEVELRVDTSGKNYREVT